MKERIVERYARTDDGRIIIDITAGRVEDLYSDFDKTAHYLKKDLDPDLVDYIVNSVREIGDKEFVIQFCLASEIGEALISRVQMSLRNFFLYMKQVESTEMQRALRLSFLLFFAGASLLTLSVWVHRDFATSAEVTSTVFAEGLTVAAWVSLWEAIGRFLFSALPHRRRIKRCARIAGAEVLFQQPALPAKQA